MIQFLVPSLLYYPVALAQLPSRRPWGGRAAQVLSVLPAGHLSLLSYHPPLCFTVLCRVYLSRGPVSGPQFRVLHCFARAPVTQHRVEYNIILHREYTLHFRFIKH